MDPPLLHPTLEDLNDRLNALHTSKRKPTKMTMSPESWARLLHDAGYRDDKLRAALAVEQRALFGLPVDLIADMKGVLIGVESDPQVRDAGN